MRAIRILQDSETNSKASKQSRLYLELAIIKMCKIEYDTSNEVILSRINKLEESLKTGKIRMVQSENINEELKSAHNNIGTNSNNNQSRNAINKGNINSNSVNLEANPNSSLTVDDVGRVWTEILEKFKAKRAMIVYASIVTAKPYSLKNGIATLEYDSMYAFNKDRLQKAEYREIVNTVFSEVLKEKVIVDYVVKNDNEVKDQEELLKETIEGIPFEIYDE